jgi:hypothetical protein
MQSTFWALQAHKLDPTAVAEPTNAHHTKTGLADSAARRSLAR